MTQHAILHDGEELHGGRERLSGLADTFEALLGAIFLDGGFEAARDFILRQFHGEFGELSALPILENPKGELQELLQSVSSDAPQYSVVSATGPDHDRLFECTVLHRGVELARGRGKSKKAAESEAALVALSKLREEKQSEAALAESRGRVAGRLGAASTLGIPSSTLESKIRALNIRKNRFK